MPREKVKGPPHAPYRIKDIVEKSGFTREKIHFYIAQGLLPPSIKTSHNMGWYSDRHLKLLAMIHKLQHERFLPLKAIKSLIEDSEDGSFTPAQSRVMLELRKHLITDHHDLAINPNLNRLAKDLDLTGKELKELRELGLARSGAATVSDVEILRFWLQFKNAGLTTKLGFSPRDMQYIFRFVEEMVLHEFELFRSRISKMTSSEVSKLLNVAMPAITGIFLVLHEQRLSSYLSAYLENANTNRRP